MDASVLGAAGGVIATATLWWITRRIASLRASWRAKYRTRRALASERDAEPLLRDLGFSVVERQARRHYQLLRDGEPFEVELRADFVLRGRGRRWVADVKTGAAAPRLTTQATRRQLLEYRVAYEVDGVLLVDMAEGLVHTIDFDLPRGAPRGGVIWSFGAGVLAGLLLAGGIAGGLWGWLGSWLAR